MAVVPKQMLDLIEFFEQRAPVWSANPETFNLSIEQTTALSNAVTEARIRYNNAQQARTDSRGATLQQNDAVDALATLGGQLVNIIRAFAIQSDDPSIFAQAGLPAPKTPEPISPVAPSDITFALDPVGSLEVRWKGVKSNGTMFTVWRSITVDGHPPAAALTQIATVGEKKFVDTAIPAGARSATYIIRAVKGDQVASSGPGTVNFVYSLNNGQQELSLAA